MINNKLKEKGNMIIFCNSNKSKRHIGNDVAIIIFKEDDSEPFNPGKIYYISFLLIFLREYSFRI